MTHSVPTYKVIVRNVRTSEEAVVAAAILDRNAALATLDGLIRADLKAFHSFRPHGLWRALVVPGKDIEVPTGTTMHRVQPSSTTWPARHGLLAARS